MKSKEESHLLCLRLPTYLVAEPWVEPSPSVFQQNTFFFRGKETLFLPEHDRKLCFWAVLPEPEN